MTSRHYTGNSFDRGCFGDKMGGKKKRQAAAQAGTSGAPSAATGSSGLVVAEEANKQLNSNKFTKPPKENKSKGEI